MEVYEEDDWIVRECRQFARGRDSEHAGLRGQATSLLCQYGEVGRECDRVIDFKTPPGASGSLSRRLSAHLQRIIQIQLPLRQVAFGAIYGGKHSLLAGRIWNDHGGLEAVAMWRLRDDLILGGASLIKGAHSSLRVSLQKGPGNSRREEGGGSTWQAACGGPSCAWAASFSTFQCTLGVQALRRIAPEVAVGGELFYAASEGSGSLSLAGRWLIKGKAATSAGLPLRAVDSAAELLVHHAGDGKPSPSVLRMQEYEEEGEGGSPVREEASEPPALQPMIASASVNPIMGHVQVSLASQLLASPPISGAVRYDFNMFSLDSDVAAGICIDAASAAQRASSPLEGAPGLPEEQSGASSEALKLRFSLKHGVSLGLSGAFKEDMISVSLGISSGPLFGLPCHTESIRVPCFAWSRFAQGPHVGISLAVNL